jgi:hypothetical protein
MIRTLLLCAILFQPNPQTAPKPSIDNDRVTVWEVTGHATVQPVDAVVVTLSGHAAFVPKGTTPTVPGDSNAGDSKTGDSKTGDSKTERSIVIDLKDHPVAPIANTSGYPLAMPRPGSKKILENDRVIVWDYTWTPSVPTPMHFHDKDVVVVFLEEGDLSSTTPDGKVTTNAYTPGTVRFNTRDRTHTEMLVRGKQHAIITELQ